MSDVLLARRRTWVRVSGDGLVIEHDLEWSAEVEVLSRDPDGMPRDVRVAREEATLSQRSEGVPGAGEHTFTLDGEDAWAIRAYDWQLEPWPSILPRLARAKRPGPVAVRHAEGLTGATDVEVRIESIAPERVRFSVDGGLSLYVLALGIDVSGTLELAHGVPISLTMEGRATLSADVVRDGALVSIVAPGAHRAEWSWRAPA